MEPVVAGALSGGFGLLGSMYSANQSAQNVAAQEQYSLANTQVAQNYNDKLFGETTQLANTAYQRASQDMKSAGLNPALMFGSGGPEATPSPGGVPPPPTPNTMARQSPLGNIGDVVSHAIGSAGAVNDLAYRAAQTDYTKQMTETEKQNTIDAANRASASGLALPGHRLSAAENEAKLAQKPEEIRQKAQTEYQYGYYGSQFVQPYQSAVKKVNEVVDHLLEKANTTSAKDALSKALDAAKQVPNYFGPGGKWVDTMDFPSFYKRTGVDAHPGM